jgi:thiamine pyrophosphate-dependent acetolactate synthase large subunit-like protein
MPFATEKWRSNQLGGQYAVIAEGLGAYAQKVETPDQLAPAIKRAIAANNKGQPALVEVLTKEEETVSRFGR